MSLELINLSKVFGSNTIIPEWNIKWGATEKIGILGSNGSGKSTFLKLLAGQLTPSSGKILISNKSPEKLPLLASYCSPHLELFDKFTVKEHFKYHNLLKPFRNGNSISDIGLSTGEFDVPLSSLSSGMKQRVKLALSIFSESPLLLLDEPCSHLDKKGIEWYQKTLAANTSPTSYFEDRIVIITSNHVNEELFDCNSYFLPTGKSVVP
jgi:ABC-type multidrug transport system ATPase subunit